MLATGTRRQRIGDLAARTAVARAAPARHRALMVVPVAVVLLAAAVLSAYRGTSPGTYRAHGVSFDYPASWQEMGYTSPSYGGGAKLWGTSVGPGTSYDSILVEAARVSLAVTAQNIDAVIPVLENDVKQLYGQAGGGMQAGPEKITMAGKPAVRFRATGVMADGTPFQSTVVFTFNGTTEYEVNCQYTAAKAAEVTRGCDQVVGSFQLG
jgi:PsbP-like protein